jgi:hypothetical protein
MHNNISHKYEFNNVKPILIGFDKVDIQNIGDKDQESNENSKN